MPVPKEAKKHLSLVSTAYVEQGPFLRRFLARYFSAKQDIDDVIQEAYVRAYAAEKAQEIRQPAAFLFRVAKNVALTELTKKSHQITDYLEDASDSPIVGSAPSAEQELEAQELLGLYCEAVATLSEKCREVFLLRKIHGLSHNEIAARMSLSISSVEKYLRTGILACDKYIREREAAGGP